MTIILQTRYGPDTSRSLWIARVAGVVIIVIGKLAVAI
jgi:hypothetical protein